MKNRYALLISILISLSQLNAQDYFDVNSYNVLINPKGNHFWDYSDKRMYVPSAPGDTTGPGTIFTSTVWIGGKDQLGNLHFAGERYASNGNDFEAGPYAETYDSTYNQYNRTWKINRSDIYQWLVNPTAQMTPQVILDWPAHGRNYAPYNESYYLAPFVDVQGEGDYGPLSDFYDYPKFPGDQAVFFMFNDAKSLNTESGGLQMGVEVRGMAYGFNCPEDSALHNTLFMHYEITNHSGNDYDSVYIGSWNDFDIGNAQDDYLASDTMRNLFFASNADSLDESAAGAVGYGSNIPAQGVRLLKGVFMDNDGVDNLPGTGADQFANGFGFGDGIADNEHLGLSAFSFTNNVLGGQNTPLEFYNQMKDTSSLVLFPNLPGDISGITSMGPFSMPSNKTVKFDIAYVFAQSNQGADSAVAKMKAYADHIQDLFDSGITPCGSFEPEFIPLGNFENQSLINWKLYPNPSYGNVTISSSISSDYEVLVLNAQGALVASFLSTSTNEVIDLSNLSSGIYFIKTASESASQIQKLILQ